ncbi:dienelactone hydrolase family protein [Candidatus Nitrososphaera sp. FF02]|uniref:dienelactone hydrolase family protein n=1 Tax=Candidatus Nitrososphaera sp. FF02 TaxID=3398226 RepID=UPI0039EAA6FE
MSSSSRIPVGSKSILASSRAPASSKGAVIIAHGSGSDISSPRNTYAADVINSSGLASVLINLLTEEEAEADKKTKEYRFKIDLLSERVVAAVDWLTQDTTFRDLPIGIYGASTGAAAALIAASQRPDVVRAVVSRGGRPDLAGSSALKNVACAVLLLVGGSDPETIQLNQKALRQMKMKDKRLVIVPGAGHLFEEKGTLEEAAMHAASWFGIHLRQ